MNSPEGRKSQKEILSKTLVWRFAIAIPLSTAVTLIYIGDLSESIEISIIANVASTILYYAYEVVWPKLWNLLSSED